MHCVLLDAVAWLVVRTKNSLILRRTLCVDIAKVRSDGVELGAKKFNNVVQNKYCIIDIERQLS